MPQPEDGRSPVARGVFWASQITTIGFMFTVPAIGGYFADQKFGTMPGLLITGTVLGFLVGMLELVKLAQRASQITSRQPRTRQPTTHQPVSPLPDRMHSVAIDTSRQQSAIDSDQPDSR